MIDKRYAEAYKISVHYKRTGDAVRITTENGKVIVLSTQAYVMKHDGQMEVVTNLIVGTPLYNVGRITKMEIIANRFLCVTPLRNTVRCNGFIVGVWERA